MRLFQRKSSRRENRRRNNFQPRLEHLEERMTPANLLPGFVETSVASDLSRATAMEFSPDGKLFIAEQAGTLEVWNNGSKLQNDFFADDPLTVNASGERGLLGIAFDPDYASNRYVYVYYTATGPVHNRVSRFTANVAGDRALADSEVVILDLNNLSSATNHNGGAIHFGPDGKLYIAVGDNANGANSQSFNNLLGKILRINPDGSIPDDNPFLDEADGQNEAIWAMGLRNPYTFAFSASGQMYINDVGQNTWEEINEGFAGANFAWPGTEGPFTPPSPNPNLRTAPIYAYRHDVGTPRGCAITGGTFYNPTTVQFPADYVGDYFFADFCGGWIYRYDAATDAVTKFADGIGAPVDLRTGSDGSLYYLARGSDEVFRIAVANGPPVILHQPQNRSTAEGLSASFSVSAVGSTPLTYQWQQFVGGNWTDIPNADAATYTVNNVQAADDGAQFRVVVSNAIDSATSNAATLDVFVNQQPLAKITAPVVNALYTAGKKYTFAGTGTDLEDGKLAASAFTWSIDFHHADHVHPFMLETAGIKSGSFIIPNVGETATDVFYRIYLKVTDSAGLSHTVSRDINPRVSQIIVLTNANDLQLNLDDQPQTVPITFASVVGMKRTLGAEATQTVNGITYDFHSWSNKGAATQTITTSARNRTYVATYYAQPPGWAYQFNFQPAGRPVPQGYLADTGEAFADHGGLMYGWNADQRRSARDRNSGRSPDQRYDTFIDLQTKSNPNAFWEIAVPNGDYQVHVVAGDASNRGSNFRILVEGVEVMNGGPATAYWMDGVVTVHVDDGRLTISNGAGALNSKLSFVEINPLVLPPIVPESAPFAAFSASDLRATAASADIHADVHWLVQTLAWKVKRQQMLDVLWQTLGQHRSLLRRTLAGL